jgi:fermentation-respiration switch protein FrsA (DUF1100 family)
MGNHAARLVILAGMLLLLIGCAPLERSLILHPQPYPLGDWNPSDLPYEDAYFLAGDGTRLHGWFTSPPQPREVVLFCHGNAGNVTSLAWVLDLYRERLNCAVLVFDYRGFGKSEGTPTEAGILQDARAARQWLAQRTGVEENAIVLVGRSLGGGVAVDLAAKDGGRGLVLENTFTSMRDMVDTQVSPLPLGWFLDMQLDSLSLIGKYHGPLLQTHGDADKLIPFEQACRLFEAANKPKVFVKAPGCGHNDMPTADYVGNLDQFLSQLANWRQNGVFQIQFTPMIRVPASLPNGVEHGQTPEAHGFVRP